MGERRVSAREDLSSGFQTTENGLRFPSSDNERRGVVAKTKMLL